jgi:DNA-binding NtrC family response regulator
MLTKAIILIDDEADLVNLFTEALQLNSFKVCGFTHPLEALNHVEKNPQDYGLVISDFKMPDMNGNELCTKLLKLNPDLKVILMSAYTDIIYEKEKFYFINKPISITRLLKIINEKFIENFITL